MTPDPGIVRWHCSSALNVMEEIRDLCKGTWIITKRWRSVHSKASWGDIGPTNHNRSFRPSDPSPSPIPRFCAPEVNHCWEFLWVTSQGTWVCVWVWVCVCIMSDKRDEGEVTIWHSGTCGNLRNVLPSTSSSFSSSGFSLGPVVCVGRRGQMETINSSYQ